MEESDSPTRQRLLLWVRRGNDFSRSLTLTGPYLAYTNNSISTVKRTRTKNPWIALDETFSSISENLVKFPMQLLAIELEFEMYWERAYSEDHLLFNKIIFTVLEKCLGALWAV